MPDAGSLELEQQLKDLIENNDFGVMIRGDLSGMTKTDLLTLDELMHSAAYKQFEKKKQDVGTINGFAFVYFWKKEEAEALLEKKLIV
ncbi:MAG: hypothetical protein EZS28_022944 [Streblomastix strix]|uniref:Uncharacterized protein n=1 Tax=Streblomastix strix TaxID=222440 RepID=A0A5J4VG32_9EUKA|nr:MAG: hypothetical protein EZS28_022944 [Streblomastix strix]